PARNPGQPCDFCKVLALGPQFVNHLFRCGGLHHDNDARKEVCQPMKEGSVRVVTWETRAIPVNAIRCRLNGTWAKSAVRCWIESTCTLRCRECHFRSCPQRQTVRVAPPCASRSSRGGRCSKSVSAQT